MVENWHVCTWENISKRHCIHARNMKACSDRKAKEIWNYIWKLTANLIALKAEHVFWSLIIYAQTQLLVCHILCKVFILPVLMYMVCEESILCVVCLCCVVVYICVGGCMCGVCLLVCYMWYICMLHVRGAGYQIQGFAHVDKQSTPGLPPGSL